MPVSNRIRRGLVALLTVAGLMTVITPATSTQQSAARKRPHGELKKLPRPDAGALVWEDVHHVSRFQQAFSVATRRGRVFSVGYVVAPGGRDAVVRANDGEAGALVWQDRVNKGGDEFASGVAADAHRVYVSGATFRPGTGYDWLLRAYHPDTGQLLWESVLDMNGGDDIPRGTALAVADGLVFLAGFGMNVQGDGDLDYLLRAYDAATGAVVWQDQLDQSPARTRSLSRTVAYMSVDGGTRTPSKTRSFAPTMPSPVSHSGNTRYPAPLASVKRGLARSGFTLDGWWRHRHGGRWPRHSTSCRTCSHSTRPQVRSSGSVRSARRAPSDGWRTWTYLPGAWSPSDLADRSAGNCRTATPW